MEENIITQEKTGLRMGYGPSIWWLISRYSLISFEFSNVIKRSKYCIINEQLQIEWARKHCELFNFAYFYYFSIFFCCCFKLLSFPTSFFNEFLCPLCVSSCLILCLYLFSHIFHVLTSVYQNWSLSDLHPNLLWSLLKM